jgi:predicted DCC family thiol-disulfide oxidoreductase YuxK
MENLSENKKIILFDGVCNLCNSSVQFIIKKDKKDIFRFVALQSDLGQEIINRIGIANQKMDTIILYEPKIAYYYKSSAVLEIAKTLGGMYRCVSIFKMIPKDLRDAIYDYIAKNRYKWYGKQDYCMIPTSELNAKFL